MSDFVSKSNRAFFLAASGARGFALRNKSAVLKNPAKEPFLPATDHSKLLEASGFNGSKIFLKTCRERVDVLKNHAIFVIPLEAGTPLIKECVLRTLGTANWTQFCPGKINGTRLRPAVAGLRRAKL